MEHFIKDNLINMVNFMGLVLFTTHKAKYVIPDIGTETISMVSVICSATILLTTNKTK
jgi:hypothetical protein